MARGHSNIFYQWERRLPALGSWQAYWAAGAVLAGCGVLKPGLDALAGQVLPPFITFYPAVMFVSLLAGPRPGFIAAVLSLLIAWYFWIAPYDSFKVINAAAAVTLGTYLATATLVAAVVGNARCMLDEKVAHANDKVRFAQETVHRIKNLIAVVQAIAFKVSRHAETQESFRHDFADRMRALGIAQDVLVRTDWRDVSIDEIVAGALAPFLPNPALQVKGGASMLVSAPYVGGLCLALYELATNSMKHGALFACPGAVKIFWGADGARLHLTWEERIDAQETPVASPTSGFGSSLIQGALNHSQGTSVRYEITPGRVFAHFDWRQPPPGAG
jgi:two-component sensor histidine kinase